MSDLLVRWMLDARNYAPASFPCQLLFWIASFMCLNGARNIRFYLIIKMTLKSGKQSLNIYEKWLDWDRVPLTFIWPKDLRTLSQASWIVDHNRKILIKYQTIDRFMCFIAQFIGSMAPLKGGRIVS